MTLDQYPTQGQGSLSPLFSDTLIEPFAKQQISTSFKSNQTYSIRVGCQCQEEGSLLLDIRSNLLNSQIIFFRKYFSCKKETTFLTFDELGFEAGEIITIQNLSPAKAAIQTKLIPWTDPEDLTLLFSDSLSGLTPLKRRKELVSKIRTHVENYRMRIPAENRPGPYILLAICSFMCGVAIVYCVRKRTDQAAWREPPRNQAPVIDEANLSERLPLRRLGEYTGRFGQPE